MKALRSFLAFLLAVVSAKPYQALASTSIDGEVLNMQHFEGHTGILIKLNRNMVDPENCGRNDWYLMPDSSPHASFVHALLLTAKSTSQTVFILINGCSDGMPRIQAVWN